MVMRYRPLTCTLQADIEPTPGNWSAGMMAFYTGYFALIRAAQLEP